MTPQEFGELEVLKVVGQTPPFRVAFAVTEVGVFSAAGDVFTAMELGAALEQRFGWLVEYRPRGTAWYALRDIDVVIAMVDEFDPRCIEGAKAGLVKIAWARNWFERWCTREWVGDYDLYLASSQLGVRYISERIGKLARLLRIATNPQRFNCDGRSVRHSLDYVFTGSYWGSDRDIAAALTAIPQGLRGAIYGKNWEAHPQLTRLYKGFVRYEELPSIYRQAAIVIDDANHVTKEWGAANSRIYDALAAGCLVITNSKTVSQDLFAGELPVYCNHEDLQRLLKMYLEDDDARKRLQGRLREQVLSRHCYAQRAFQFRTYLEMDLSKAHHGAAFKIVQARMRATAGAAKQSEVHADSAAIAPVPIDKLPTISFIVPLFNHLEQTQEMLATLQATIPAGVAHEIILIDDFSSDGTRAWLDTLSDPLIKTQLNAVNLGYARSNNVAAALATGSILALLNNDLVFEPGWLEPMLQILQSPQLNAGVVGNVQVRVADATVDHAGVQLKANGQFEHIQSLPDGVAPYTKALAVTGACMLLRKADFDSLGGFDPRFVNGGEDIDLCFKMRAAGKAVYMANTSRIRHHVSLSRDRSSQQNERNSRQLFAIWRATIKRELAARWALLIQSGPRAYAGDLSGQLAPALAATPHTAATVIAEAMLQRQEHRWARQLDGADPNANIADRCGASGLLFVPALDGYTMGPSAEWGVTGLCSARNFYVCGHTVVDLAVHPIAIAISVNGIQSLVVTLTQGRSVNVGIINPLVLPGISNYFKVEAYFVEPGGARLGDAAAAIVITHIVIDDQSVCKFSCPNNL